MDPFPGENEHSISWQIKDYSGHIRCYLTGCSLCDDSNVFLEKVPDDEGVNRLALRRTLTSTKTISVKFRGKCIQHHSLGTKDIQLTENHIYCLGLEDFDLAKAADVNLTKLLMVGTQSYILNQSIATLFT